MDKEKLKSIIESILFVSGDPVAFSKLAKGAGVSEEEARQICDELGREYQEQKRGVVLIRKNDLIQMGTTEQNADFISGMIKNEMQENLSRAGLEVLSIVAYRGPITRSEIELIRGVNCSFTVRSLLMRGLLERIDNPRDSRGFLYQISFDFLRFLGIDSVEKLPDWEVLSKDSRVESVIGNQE